MADCRNLSRLWENGAGMEQDRTISKNLHWQTNCCRIFQKTVDNSPFSWYNNTRRQGRRTSYGGLAQLGARLVSKHTPSQIVLRQSNSQQKNSIQEVRFLDFMGD